MVDNKNLAKNKKLASDKKNHFKLLKKVKDSSFKSDK
ncbi:hypothetical protein PRV_02240 [Mycoplasma parvum str. Indiana]|uniref:Uncharacterized protein n=1 Tax=Mycoplasma parvum str. Indiana TaxID=1403316 RepID=U5NC81_9MOLU|nr:hypothetical protein PRV_02240 [Mycoplasma parvum str. Indiana]